MSVDVLRLCLIDFYCSFFVFFFFKQKTAYEMRISDWSSDVCSSDLLATDFWEIFIVDPMHRPVGTCQLSWILRAPRSVAISDAMKREQTQIGRASCRERVCQYV